MAKELDSSQLEEQEDEEIQFSTDPSEDSLVKRASRVGLNLLPAIGATGGAIVGGIGGTVAGFGVGGVPGSIGGGAIGGAAGESFRQIGSRIIGDENVPETSGEALKGIGGEAVIGGAMGAVGGLGGKAIQGIAKGARLATAPTRGAAGELIRQAEVKAGARSASALADDIVPRVQQRVVGTTAKGAPVRETAKEAETRFLNQLGSAASKGNLSQLDNNTLVRLFQRVDDIASSGTEKALTKGGISRAKRLKTVINEVLDERVPGRKLARQKFARAATKEDLIDALKTAAKFSVPGAIAGTAVGAILSSVLRD